MIHYDKFELSGDTLSIPRLSMQVLEVPCFHCGCTTRCPVPTAYVDWETIAESYRKLLEDTMRDFDQMSSDVEIMHGENPAAEYVANRLRMIVLEVQRKLHDPNRESGA